MRPPQHHRLEAREVAEQELPGAAPPHVARQEQPIRGGGRGGQDGEQHEDVQREAARAEAELVQDGGALDKEGGQVRVAYLEPDLKGQRAAMELVHRECLGGVVPHRPDLHPVGPPGHVVLVDEDARKEGRQHDEQAANQVCGGIGGGGGADGHAAGGGGHVGEHQQDDKPPDAAGAARVQPDGPVRQQREEGGRQHAQRQDVERVDGDKVGRGAVRGGVPLAAEQQPLVVPYRQRGEAHQAEEEQQEEKDAQAVLRAADVVACIVEDGRHEHRHAEIGQQVDRDEEGVAVGVAQQAERQAAHLRPEASLVAAGWHRLRRCGHARHPRGVVCHHARHLKGLHQGDHHPRPALDHHVQHPVRWVGSALLDEAVVRKEVERAVDGSRVDHLPVAAHQQHAVQQRQHVAARLVDGEHHSGALPRKVRQDVHHARCVGGVQASCGLV
mmetsp:Transcript_42867/g.108469  ORF Transcript_42867/g.108469 Transcript_42867/m.108469 type:complete len:443 (-) Transcript_42867:251-1579(-)